MNRFTTIAAIASAAVATQFASAASFLGNAVAGGVMRVVAAVSQNTLVAQFPALPAKVTMCDGSVETPLFFVTGAATAQANGSTYFIRATILGPDRTRFEVVHTNATNNGIKRIVLGGGVQSIAFDQTMPNPGTAGSFSGRNATYLSGAGIWGVRAIWGNAIRVGGLAAQGDLYNTFTLDFNACFDAWDSLVIETDTDLVN
jgi:hypothetical protein